MEIGKINGATRELGRSQGFQPLPVRDDITIDAKRGIKQHVMATEWVPTDEERKAIANGANILLCVLGAAGPMIANDVDIINTMKHPPVKLVVGEVPKKFKL